mmetsp:Transcript_15275/g.36609  ORF Transcript_15275/g.36609 Transcript_15275/m.36609 type:complete len:211 (-) Transcript_15275:27-659(-)
MRVWKQGVAYAVALVVDFAQCLIYAHKRGPRNSAQRCRCSPKHRQQHANAYFTYALRRCLRRGPVVRRRKREAYTWNRMPLLRPATVISTAARSPRSHRDQFLCVVDVVEYIIPDAYAAIAMVFTVGVCRGIVEVDQACHTLEANSLNQCRQQLRCEDLAAILYLNEIMQRVSDRKRCIVRVAIIRAKRVRVDLDAHTRRAAVLIVVSSP